MTADFAGRAGYQDVLHTLRLATGARLGPVCFWSLCLIVKARILLRISSWIQGNAAAGVIANGLSAAVPVPWLTNGNFRVGDHQSANPGMSRVSSLSAWIASQGPLI
jgi:hypothetical protein